MKSQNLRKAMAAVLAVATLASTVPAHANNQDAGTIFGGLMGAVIGSQFGNSDEQKVGGAIIGAIVGGVIGNQIGESLDENDRVAVRYCQRNVYRAKRGVRVQWVGSEYGSHTGAYGNMYWNRQGRSHNHGYICRNYISEVYAHGHKQVSQYSACQYPDGSWREVETQYIDYGNDDYGPQPGHGHHHNGGWDNDDDYGYVDNSDDFGGGDFGSY